MDGVVPAVQCLPALPSLAAPLPNSREACTFISDPLPLPLSPQPPPTITFSKTEGKKAVKWEAD